MGIPYVANNISCVISISFITTALIVCIVVIIIMIVLMLGKAKIKAALDLQLTKIVGRSTHVESTYEDVTGTSPSVSTINTQSNVAYGHTKGTKP